MMGTDGRLKARSDALLDLGPQVRDVTPEDSGALLSIWAISALTCGRFCMTITLLPPVLSLFRQAVDLEWRVA